jgi:hypothetical protein
MESKLFQYIEDGDDIRFRKELNIVKSKPNVHINKIKRSNDPKVTLLQYAILLNQYEIMKVLLDNGININYKVNKENDTYLIYALKLKKPITASFLIEHGANVEVINKQNETPLSIATKEKSKYDEVIKLMVFLINNEDEFKEVLSKQTNINQIKKFINIRFGFKTQVNRIIKSISETERENIMEDPPIVAVIGLYYLIKKYNNACVPKNIREFTLENITDERQLPLMKWMCLNGRRRLLTFNDTEFMKMYDRCLTNTSIRFIVISLGLYDRYDCSTRDEEQGHANILIHDKEKRTIERFEPNGVIEGGDWFEYEKLDKELKKFFIVKNNFNIKEYLYPTNICPREGPQAIQSSEEVNENSNYLDGYCIVWSHFYLYLRLEFPDIPQMDLVDLSINALKGDQRSFSDFISDYTNAIVKISKEIEEEYLARRLRKRR